MDTVEDGKDMNERLDDPVLGSTIKAKVPSNPLSVYTAACEGFIDGMTTFAKMVDQRLTDGNDQIQQLLSRIVLLEERTSQQNTRIKSLEDQVASKDTLEYKQ